MSIAEFYQKQCLDKLKENYNLTLAKLSDPSSFVQTNIGDLLASGSGDGMGNLAQFATDYLQANAGGIVLAALKATGHENSVLDGLNLFYKMLAQAFAAYNDLILLFLKKQAQNCQKELDKKIAMNTDLKGKLTQLVNSLLSLDAGDPLYDAYIQQLRQALIQLNSGKNDIVLARNTLQATDQFLPKVYRRGRDNVRNAVKKIKPPTDSFKIIISQQHDGHAQRTSPAVLSSGKQPGAAEFQSVKVGDTVIITMSHNSQIKQGTYTVAKKISDSSLQLSGQIFDTSNKGPDHEDLVTSVGFYVQTIVKGVGAAVASSVIKDIGIPTAPEQIENILAIPKLIKLCIVSGKGYLTQTLKVNNLLDLYYAGLDALLSGLPDIMKQYVLSLFTPVIDNLNTLIGDMAVTLNNGVDNIIAPAPRFQPQALNVATHAFKWSMDGNLIVEEMKLIPASVEVIHERHDGVVAGIQPNKLLFPYPNDAVKFSKVKPGDNVEIADGDFTVPGSYTVIKNLAGTALLLDKACTKGLPKDQTVVNVRFTVETDGALGEYQLTQNIINVYKRSVAQLQALGTIKSGGAVLIADQAKEEAVPFESALLTFLLQAAPSVLSGKSRKELIGLGNSLIARCDLAIARDTNVKQILQTFVATPIPLEDTLNQMLDSLHALMKALGLDKAFDALVSGDYAKLFGMNSKNATYLGAAIEALAFLKTCFPSDADRSVFEEAENGLKGQKDLFNIKLSFNFDLAILQNIKDCLDLNNLAKLFLTKEFICGLVNDAASSIGSSFDALEDLVSGGG